jgi:hypothetical protein
MNFGRYFFTGILSFPKSFNFPEKVLRIGAILAGGLRIIERRSPSRLSFKSRSYYVA